jgi:hypothetical protein
MSCHVGVHLDLPILVGDSFFLIIVKDRRKESWITDGWMGRCLDDVLLDPVTLIEYGTITLSLKIPAPLDVYPWHYVDA